MDGSCRRESIRGLRIRKGRFFSRGLTSRKTANGVFKLYAGVIFQQVCPLATAQTSSLTRVVEVFCTEEEKKQYAKLGTVEVVVWRQRGATVEGLNEARDIDIGVREPVPEKAVKEAAVDLYTRYVHHSKRNNVG